jgi:copper chaperone CopZ
MSFSSLFVVTNALRLNKFKSKFEEERKIMENTKVIYIDGMSCNHCKMSVEKALNAIDGITSVEVNLEEKNAVITFNKEIENDIIKNVIEEEGFIVKEIK